MKNIRQKQHTQKGFAMLYTALIIGTITTSFAFVVSNSSIYSIRLISLAQKQYIFANYATTCVERVLMEVRDDPDSDISGTISLDDADCEYDVSGSVPNKIVDTTTVWDGGEIERVLTITQTNPQIEMQ